ncbi:XdhC family protein [Microbacterium sp.]|uniref:XdhC family protein n=1 Tax=Microbacterium sp. TaxID=51671 RepID=UPI0039E38AEE
MREILPVAAEWARGGRAFAVATVVSVERSAPRGVGASLVVSEDGDVFGTVSAGCVEGVVYERCLEVLATGEAVIERFGIGDDFAAGLTCGGSIEVLVRPVRPGSAAARELVLLAERDAVGLPASLALVVAPADRRGESWLVTGEGCETDAAASVVVVPVQAPRRLVVVGAVEFSVALARLAHAMGFEVTVADARDVFATPARFPHAQVVVDWPHRVLERLALDSRTAVCVLSHDPRFDVPALRVALASPAGYVGAMGSRTTHEDRLRRLAEAGVPAAQRERLRSPIGLDLGGRTPEETALSILAEIVADAHGATGRRHSELSGPVHAPLRQEEAISRGAASLPGVADSAVDASAAADSVAVGDARRPDVCRARLRRGAAL